VRICSDAVLETWRIVFRVCARHPLRFDYALPSRTLRNRRRVVSSLARALLSGAVNSWNNMIDPKDLDAVKDRNVGRPRKARKASKR